MDLGTIVGLVATVVVISIVMIMDGGSPMELFAHPSAILLTLVGSLVTTVTSLPLKAAMAFPKLIILSIQTNKFNTIEVIDMLSTMADQARREGLLALEKQSKEAEDAFLRKGLMMVVDGVDPKQVKEILEIEIKQMAERHAEGIGLLEKAGGYAPTFGIIGTVMGMIVILQQLDEPATLGRAIAGAFLATLWGLIASNVIYLPLAGKLQHRSHEEQTYRRMLIEGILSIQAGENPRIIREKLSAFLAPKDREAAAEGGKASAPQGARAEA